MFSHLKGKVEAILEGGLILDVHDVGYHIFSSRQTLNGIEIGAAVKIYIEPHIREDHIHLYGFKTQMERNWFRLLTTVQGVGAKVCLAILSALENTALENALIAQDKNAFTLADGVGPKLAARIINELKDKTASFPSDDALITSHNELPSSLSINNSLKGQTDKNNKAISQTMNDAISALINLGYKKFEVHPIIMRLHQKEGPLEIDDYIRRALQELAA